MIPLPHMRPERKRHIEKYTPDTKQRVDRNFNESPLVRHYNLKKLTPQSGINKGNARIGMDRYNAALIYLETYFAAYPTQSHEYKPRVDGSGKPMLEYCLAAEDRILRCAQLMSQSNYKALQLYLIDELSLAQISTEMGKGWGRKSVLKRLGEVLDELGYVWGRSRGHVRG